MFKEYYSLAKMTLLLFDFNIMANVENIFETNNTFTAGNLASNIWIVLTSENKRKQYMSLIMLD